MRAELERIRSSDRYRRISYLESAQGRDVQIGGKKYLVFSSNNYLGLCNDRRLKRIAVEAVESFGVGTGGSRLTTGSNVLHRELEDSIARFKGRESAMVYGSGYMANVGVISAVTDSNWAIFCDRLNHASIVDGIRLSGAKLLPYRHNDMEDLEAKVRRYAREKNLIVTDGVFSMDGDIANIHGIVDIARRYGAMTMVDDAHGTGVLGKRGRGTEEHLGIEGVVDICLGTMSKALGGEGGFVAGSETLIDYLRQTSRSFIYSTSLSPSSTSVAIGALDIASGYQGERAELGEKSSYFRKAARAIGLDVLDGETPIVPIILGDEGIALEYSSKLMDAGIYVPCIRPPTVPKGSSRLRVTLTVEHSYGDLDTLLERLNYIGREIGVI